MRARIIAVCLAMLLVDARAFAAAESACSAKLEAGPAHSVVRIIDGETVGLDDGSELRLIGALAPRALDVGVGPEKWAAETRSREALGELVAGRSIELKFDSARSDRYGRLQAQAFLIEGEQRLWIQRHLVSQGFARAYSLSGNATCIEELLAAESAARVAGLGLWAEAAYQVRSASEPDQLIGYRTTFQLVEGQVVRAASVRGSIYLNFDRNWRDAFFVSLRRDDRKLLGTFATDPKMLEGRRVRVRGWIDVRNGPRIDLSAGGAIEVIPDPPAAAGLVSPR
jgi:endonuclease YncB( thermonuclease family)